MATDEIPSYVDSDDLPSHGGDAEVPEGMSIHANGTPIEGTGSTGGIGTGDQAGEVSGDLTTGPDQDPTSVDEDSGD